MIVASEIVLRFSRRVAWLDDDEHSDCQFGAHTFAKRHDLASSVATRNNWKRQARARNSSAHPKIEMIDRRREHSNQNLARRGFGALELDDAEYFGTAVFLNLYSLHSYCPVKRGSRFSRKAAMPSAASSD